MRYFSTLGTTFTTKLAAPYDTDPNIHGECSAQHTWYTESSCSSYSFTRQS